jgi:hypothetical protein
MFEEFQNDFHVIGRSRFKIRIRRLSIVIQVPVILTAPAADKFWESTLN